MIKCAILKVMKYELLKESQNMEFLKGDQMWTFKRVITGRISKEWSNLEF